MDHQTQNQEIWQEFYDLLKEWAQATSGKNYDHFGKFLTDTKGFQKKFKISLNQLSRLKNENRKSYAGMITHLVFNGTSIRITIYDPKKTILEITLEELPALYFESQPKDGTQFIIENEELVKKDVTKIARGEINEAQTKQKPAMVS